jgi:citrate lyase beta subunit
MLQSYFFIPGNHPRLSEKLETIQADFLIIDMEDSISPSEIDFVLDRITKLDHKPNLFVRPRLFERSDPGLTLFGKLLERGFRNFVIPKFRNSGDLFQLEKYTDQLSITGLNLILLIENPESLFSLQDILRNTHLNISSIGFGSQDFCNEAGMEHKSELLKIPRFMISGIAKAFSKMAIDIACMDISNDETFVKEMEEAEVMGFNGKFMIHPRQLLLSKNHSRYSELEVQEAERILAEFERLDRPTVFVYRGKAVEPPHIHNYQKIINWKNNDGSK